MKPALFKGLIMVTTNGEETMQQCIGLDFCGRRFLQIADKMCEWNLLYGMDCLSNPTENNFIGLCIKCDVVVEA